MSEKREKIMQYISTNLLYKNVANIFFLTELLIFDNLIVKAKIVELIYFFFSQRRNFMEAMNNVLLINFLNMDLYKDFWDITTLINFCIISLDYYKSEEKNERKQVLHRLNDALLDLI